jgi:hypothetical protein
VGMSAVIGMVGSNAFICILHSYQEFVLLCSKQVSVIFYALDESEKNGQLCSEPGVVIF